MNINEKITDKHNVVAVQIRRKGSFPEKCPVTLTSLSRAGKNTESQLKVLPQVSIMKNNTLKSNATITCNIKNISCRHTWNVYHFCPLPVHDHLFLWNPKKESKDEMDHVYYRWPRSTYRPIYRSTVDRL